MPQIYCIIIVQFCEIRVFLLSLRVVVITAPFFRFYFLQIHTFIYLLLMSKEYYSSGRNCSTSTSDALSPASSEDVVVVKTRHGEVSLAKEDAAPTYLVPRGDGKRDALGLVPHKNGDALANYVLFEESMKMAEVPWNKYNGQTSEERTIYMAHLRAVEERRLSYKDPITGYTVMTVSKLLNNGKCCGNGCRHCPYEHENAKEDVKKSKVWNGAFYV